MNADRWTHGDVPDQSGRVAVITGANSGIGFQAAKVLAGRGAHVVLACRNPTSAADAEAEIRATHESATTSLVTLDLSSFDSVRSAAAELRRDHDRIDLLINNAGVMATPRSKTADGFELQLGTNHLGHFALTGLLVDLLTPEAGSRVVTVSSQAHRFGKIDFDDLMWERRYRRWGAYGRSKLANLLFTYELDRRLTAAAAPTVAVAAHPGNASTNLVREGSAAPKLLMPVARRINGMMAQSAAMGALPTLRAATDLEVVGSEYYGPAGRGQQTGPPVRVTSTQASLDQSTAARLWAVSEDLTGVEYPFD